MHWTFLLVFGCAKEPRFIPAPATEETAESFASGLVLIESATVTLGETDASVIDEYDGDGEEVQTIIPAAEHNIAAFYIDRYPFPGVAGEEWFTDGTRHNTIEALDATLADFGRRVCRISELMYAAAGPDNHRYPYGDGDTWGNACDPDDENPSPIGTFSDCRSTMGIHDFQVRSTWGRIDNTTMVVMQDTPQADGFPGELVYAVWGGTSRDDTYYAPNNYGFHTHGKHAEDLYLDDGFRVCADDAPTQAQDSAYARWLRRAVEAGSYEVLFSR